MRAVAYTRVSSLSQVDGYSLDAQERSYKDYCRSKGWEALHVYREEGRSAHHESIRKRPVFRQLLEDAGKGSFDVVIIHTLDRWSRNLKVLLESISTLDKHEVGLVSITENLDWSTAQGRLVARTLGSFGEFFSDMLATHVKKGIQERALQGLHLGAIPFGYESCWKEEAGEKRLLCQPEHSGGLHPHPEEGAALQELFRKYSTGRVTLSNLAAWLNNQGFRTRNRHKLLAADGNLKAEPRMFTTASVRGILHNSFYTGKVRHKNQVLPGVHEPLISEELYQAVQLALKRNSGRSETLQSHPEREYLLKGLIRCAYCGMPMWAQTYKSGHRCYREHKGSRGDGACVKKSGSIGCDVPDSQMGQIMEAIVLPESWLDRALAKIHLADEKKRVEQERKETDQRLRRLAQVYIDGLLIPEEYQRQKRQLEDRLGSLVVPGVDATEEAGKLLENLPDLWAKANPKERREILLTMLDAVYVDAVEEKRVVGLRPKPAFWPLFEIATTREGSDVVLVTELPFDNEGETETSCFWWRRGRVELPVQKNMPQISYKLSRLFVLTQLSSADRV